MFKRYIDQHGQPKPVKIAVHAVITLVVISAVISAIFTVPEGHVKIVKKFGEATHQVNPGLRFKVPFIESTELMEIRTRRATEELAAATSEQMPVKAITSVNWTVVKSEAINLFRKYGGLEQFENRILDPRLQASAKQAIAQYSAEQLVKDREGASLAALELFKAKMEGFPVSLDSLQIENVGLPKVYLDSIQTKQTEKNLAEAEEHKLAKQAFTAQQDVNIKKATADGINLVSIAKAAAIEREGLAEAAAIEAKGTALADNPLLVALTHEQQWNGSLITTMLGSNTGLLVDEQKLIK